jgi:hypothetical protein
MATRILAAWYLTRQDEDYPATNFDAWHPNGPTALHVNAQTNDTDELRSVHSFLTEPSYSPPFNSILRVGLHTRWQLPHIYC